MHVRKLIYLSLSVLALGALVEAQDLGRRLGGSNGPTPTAADPNRPPVKLADGTIDFSGVWTGGGGEEIESVVAAQG